MSTSYKTRERENPITTVLMTRHDRVSRKAVEEYHQRKYIPPGSVKTIAPWYRKGQVLKARQGASSKKNTRSGSPNSPGWRRYSLAGL
jgi:hypothetical protein